MNGTGPFRCSKPPFDDWRWRKAAAHAIDQTIIYDIMGSAGAEASNRISPIKFGYVGLPDYPEYDPDECQRLLAEAGYLGGDGLPDLQYIPSMGFYPKTFAYGQIIAALPQEQGFPVTLNVMEAAAWNEALTTGPAAVPAT